MSVWDIRMEREEITFGNALVSLYRIESDTAMAERETVHTHSYYELHGILRGNHTYTVGGKDVPVQSGQLLIIPPETAHKAVPLREKDNIAVLSVSVRLLPSGEPVYHALMRHLEACAAAPVPIGGGLTRLMEEYSCRDGGGGMGNVFHRKLSACQILVGVFDAVGCGRENNNAAEHADFAIMLETLVSNSGVPLYEIAQRLGYSQRQMSRIIQKRYGKTFTQLRKERK